MNLSRWLDRSCRLAGCLVLEWLTNNFLFMKTVELPFDQFQNKGPPGGVESLLGKGIKRHFN